jgi:hypothetical protein
MGARVNEDACAECGGVADHALGCSQDPLNWDDPLDDDDDDDEDGY